MNSSKVRDFSIATMMFNRTSMKTRVRNRKPLRDAIVCCVGVVTDTVSPLRIARVQRTRGTVLKWCLWIFPRIRAHAATSAALETTTGNGNSFAVRFHPFAHFRYARVHRNTLFRYWRLRYRTRDTRVCEMLYSYRSARTRYKTISVRGLKRSPPCGKGPSVQSRHSGVGRSGGFATV